MSKADVSHRGVIGTSEETEIKYERRRNNDSETIKTSFALPRDQLGGKDASFLANVILHHHQRPMKKLRGLAKLLRAGHRVQTAQFSLNVLVIDGQRTEWSRLEAA